MNIDPRLKKLLIVLGILGTILLLLLLGFNIWRNYTYAKLVVGVAPEDTVLSFDGKSFKSPGTIYVRPDTYKLLFNRAGFSSYDKKVQLQKGKTTKVYVALYANSAQGKEYLAAHPGAQALLERIGGLMDEQSTAELTQKCPIVKDLPTTQAVGGAGEFTVKYDVVHKDGETSCQITVTYDNDTTKVQALEWLQQKHYDPAAYPVKYINLFTSPAPDAESHTD